MIADKPYWSIILGYVPNGTKWHPTESTGPFAVLSRGCFRSTAAADAWAAANIPGHSYTLRVYW